MTVAVSRVPGFLTQINFQTAASTALPPRRVLAATEVALPSRSRRSAREKAPQEPIHPQARKGGHRPDKAHLHLPHDIPPRHVPGQSEEGTDGSTDTTQQASDPGTPGQQGSPKPSQAPHQQKGCRPPQVWSGAVPFDEDEAEGSDQDQQANGFEDVPILGLSGHRWGPPEAGGERSREGKLPI